MRLKSIELSGFKSFAKKTPLEFASAITAIVGPNGSGKSNIAESFRFVLGEQSMKSMRGKRGEDMIWNGSTSVPRAGRAGVRLVFDNADRALSIDFDEVAIERVVHRDGGNDYLLNGSHVRLRDISELLAQANIGSSGHHIISQGEADRILSTSARERREMIEDALGLTAYLYKREEAERKLEKASENMREVEALRRELSPHLRFLAAQVKKIEEGMALRSELSERYLEYLKRESVYLRLCDALAKEEGHGPRAEKEKLEHRITHLREELDAKREGDSAARELMSLEEKARTAAARREHITRELGRLEGEISAHDRLAQRAAQSIPAQEARAFAEGVERELAQSASADAAALQRRIAAVLLAVREFIGRLSNTGSHAREDAQLHERKAALERELGQLKDSEERTGRDVSQLRARIEGEKDASRDAERELFAAMARRSELETAIAAVRAKEEMLARDRERFKMELAEAGALVGMPVSQYEDYAVVDERGAELSDAEIADEDRAVQEQRRRRLERTKIKLEEIGAGNADEILKEHRETSERDAFLGRELEDISASMESLRTLIGELTQTLEVRFSDGVDRINTEFDAFFKLMFGGGSAALSIVKERKMRRGLEAGSEDDDDDEEEYEEGVDIAVTLPHKRIKGLHMLSGGERALTSIALIFAMSQVNPPPFLILDETDAALDEANSRRYGDMIENLARKSQLIVITHNRETMSRAGVLYGITMGGDGASKLLSVQFEEALAVAK